jgi:hypothetical protein
MKYTVRLRELWKQDALNEIRKGPTTIDKMIDGRRAPEKISLAVDALIATGKVVRDAQGFLRINS